MPQNYTPELKKNQDKLLTIQTDNNIYVSIYNFPTFLIELKLYPPIFSIGI